MASDSSDMTDMITYVSAVTAAVGGAGVAVHTTGRIRVRALLSAMNSVERANLKKLLPKTAMPTADTARYPNALLGVLPKGESYALLGWITEDMLRLAPADITIENLVLVTKKWHAAADTSKVIKSKTTEPFLTLLRETRRLFRFAAKGDIRYDEVVHSENVEGHPDGRTATQIFEVKMTGQLKQNWNDFLFQVFAYGALAPETTDVYLVLPMQQTVWHHSLASWTKRADYRAFLEAAATKRDASAGDALVAALLCEMHLVGSHISKQKSLVTTVLGLPDPRKPYQIFLSGPQTSRMSIADAELAATAAAIADRKIRVFVHSQYIINLCVANAGDDWTPPSLGETGTNSSAASSSGNWNCALLIKNLQYGKAMGARGVVVHVGKSTTQPLETAMATMRTNILAAIEHASPECPLLLETPAGQGTEVLCETAPFLDFVKSIADPRLRICVDTCHVFACGHDPANYVRAAHEADPGLLKLIHFNDSATPCGARVDRHAFCGQGHIGITKMTEVAELATSASIPLVIE
jgi:deoxyribonuclease-4